MTSYYTKSRRFLADLVGFGPVKVSHVGKPELDQICRTHGDLNKKVVFNFFRSFVSDFIQKNFQKNLEVSKNYLIRVVFRFNHRVYDKFGPVRVFPRD